ncbi:MAG: modification methylase PaeR7I, partial [Pyrinomonadaceae bacterium]
MQPNFFEISVEQELPINIEQLSLSESKSRGAVFTRPEIVNLILDLVGYTTDKSLYLFGVLEPSFGNGSFIMPVIKRLIQ